MSDADTARYYQGAYRDEVSGAGGISPDDLRIQKTRAALQARHFARYAAGVKSCLEIGSSAGCLLAELAALGLDCTGIEPDRRYHALEDARKFPLYADVSDLPAGACFDAFALSHSLEHLNHPREYIESLIARHSYGRARFLVEVPNLAISSDVLNAHHPFAFTLETLDGLFSMAGCARLYATFHDLGRTARKRYILAIYEVRHE